MGKNLNWRFQDHSGGQITGMVWFGWASILSSIICSGKVCLNTPHDPRSMVNQSEYCSRVTTEWLVRWHPLYILSFTYAQKHSSEAPLHFDNPNTIPLSTTTAPLYFAFLLWNAQGKGEHPYMQIYI